MAFTAATSTPTANRKALPLTAPTSGCASENEQAAFSLGLH